MAQHWFVDHMEKLGEAGFDSLGKYLSVYRGIVMENVDPETLGRIQCCIPDLTDHFTYPKWIYPKGMYAGKTFEGVQYGCQVIPEIGDVVFITFEQGDIESPLWEHGYRGEDDVPTEEELTDVQSYWFKSPAGHILSISDTNKTITITHAKGHHIQLAESEISLDTEQGHSITIDDEDGKISLEVDKGHSITIDNEHGNITIIHKDGNKILVDKDVISLLHKNGMEVLINDSAISLISSKAVSLGSKNIGKEPAVLGNKNADVLTQLKTAVQNLAGILNASIAAGSGTGFYTIIPGQTNSDIALTLAQISTIAALIPPTKSTKVTLD